jgi:hypothetical protein
MSEIELRRTLTRPNSLFVAGGCLAVLALSAAFYFFSLGVLFESGCHMGNEASCADLARSLRAALVFACVGLVIVSIIGASALVRRLRDQR